MTARVATAMRKLARGAPVGEIQHLLPQIAQGGDPLGDFFVKAVSPDERRLSGATLTPDWLIDLQLSEIAALGTPDRVVDAGAGTGRYALRAAKRWPDASIIAVEKDADLAEVIRINAEAAGIDLDVRNADYLSLTLQPIDGITAFIGNPPYVRHHDISGQHKKWYAREMSRLKLPHSQLAGLHVYFFLKSYLLSQKGDVGSFVSAAEWMETNYGKGMRELFCLMGGDTLVRIHPSERVFHDALTTSVIATWRIGSENNVAVCDLLESNVRPKFKIPHVALKSAPKWPGHNQWLSVRRKAQLRLGDLFKISRGQVTGCNDIWIVSKETEGLVPDRYLFPCVTDAMEIIHARGLLRDARKLRKVIDLPVDFDGLSRTERNSIDRFLKIAERAGAAGSYIAKHRKPWWRVGLKAAPPIVMSYMGRRPPVFARNVCNARIINIAHGLFPQRAMNVRFQDELVDWLNKNVRTSVGRTYGGGMVKFEPSDAMDIPLPTKFATSCSDG